MEQPSEDVATRQQTACYTPLPKSNRQIPGTAACFSSLLVWSHWHDLVEDGLSCVIRARRGKPMSVPAGTLASFPPASVPTQEMWPV